MKRFSTLFCLVFISACFLVTGQVHATAYHPCGSFKSVSGQVTIKRGQNEITAVKGARIFPKDRIISSENSSAALILEDDTIICLGPDSTMEMNSFIFDPSVYAYGMATRILKGSFLFLSGVIAKLAPEKVKIDTPDGTIAVRGTRFLVEVKN